MVIRIGGEVKRGWGVDGFVDGCWSFVGVGKLDRYSRDGKVWYDRVG